MWGWIGFGLGLIIGGGFGAVIMALLQFGAEADRYEEEELKKIDKK